MIAQITLEKLKNSNKEFKDVFSFLWDMKPLDYTTVIFGGMQGQLLRSM